MTVPRRVCKYQPFTPWSVENLRRRAIWFSKPASFNDPFDCNIRLDTQPIADSELEARIERVVAMIPSEAEKVAARRALLRSGRPSPQYRAIMTAEAEQYLREYTRHALHDYGVACFSEVHDSLLMWSHYASGHTGFCLEFDTSIGPFSAAAQVRYREEVLSVSPLDAGFFGKGDNFAEVLTVKASCWAYEREWRLFSHRPDSLEELPPGCLTTVYLGVAMSLADKDRLAKMLVGSTISLREVRQSRTAFKLESHPYMS